MTNTELLKDEIKRANMSPPVLAALWGVSLPTYYKLINGEGEFTARMITASVQAFGLSPAKRDAIFFAAERE